MGRKTVAVRAGCVFGVCFAVGVIVAATSPAEAKWVRQHAVDCFSEGNFLEDHENIGPWGEVDSDKNGLQATQPPAQAIPELLCPVPDSDYFPKSNITQINVHGWDTSTAQRLRARVCTQWWNSDVGSCDSWRNGSVSGTGYAELLLTSSFLDPLDGTSDFAYVEVEVPGDGSSGNLSQLNGLYYVQP